MILLTKSHPAIQGMSGASTPADLMEPGLRRSPGEPDAEQSRTSEYRKPRVQWRGLTIAIENPAGSVRRGRNRDGVTWEQRMLYAYGEILGTMGVDGDPVDVFLGPNMDAPIVYVVHQRKVNRWDDYDEDKCMVGFDSEDEAKAAFLACYTDPRFLGPITAMPADEFIAKVRTTKEKPAMIKAVLFFKSHVGPYLRGGKVVNLAGYQGRAAHGTPGGPGQLSLFGSNKPLGPNPYKGKHPVDDTGDLFDADEHGEMPPARRAYREPQHTEPTRELIDEHERLVDVLNSPSHADDKAEAKKQAEELADMKQEATAKPKEDPRVKEVGQRVALSRVKQAKYVGMNGHVAAHIKSRNVVKVALDNGEYYDASPENIDVHDDGVVGAGFKEITDAKARREASAARRAEKQERDRVEKEKAAKAAEKKAEKVSSVMPGVPESDHKKIMLAVQRARRLMPGSHVVVSHYGAPMNIVFEQPFKSADAAERYAAQKYADDKFKGTHGVFSPRGSVVHPMTKSIIFLRRQAS